MQHFRFSVMTQVGNAALPQTVVNAMPNGRSLSRRADEGLGGLLGLAQASSLRRVRPYIVMYID